MEQINKLICFLLAIENFAKDIHYTCHGEAFYSKHLLVDRIHDGLAAYQDELKETYILGNGLTPGSSAFYLRGAIDLIPDVTIEDKQNFSNMQFLITDTLQHIDGIKNLTNGEQSLVDDIAKNLQQKLGLVNLQVK